MVKESTSNGGGPSELTMHARLHPEKTAARIIAALKSYAFLEDAARALGVSVPTLTRVAKDLGIEKHLPNKGEGRGRPLGLKWRKTLSEEKKRKSR